jgi:hypothetical protein
MSATRTTIQSPWADDEEPVMGHVDPAVPLRVRHRVGQVIAGAISGKGILRGERLPGMIDRVAPGALAAFAMEGYRVNLDIPQNTHEALCRGKLAVEIRVASH